MFLERLGRWFDRAEGFLAAAAAILLVAVSASVCLEVVMRYGFNQPLFWVVEIAEYSLVYITFLGAAWVLKEDGHVKIELLLSVLSAAWRNRLGLVGAVLGLGVCLVLTIFGARITWINFLRGSYKPTLIEMPTWLVLIVIPLGSLFLCVRFSRQIAGYVRALRGHDLRPEA